MSSMFAVVETAPEPIQCNGLHLMVDLETLGTDQSAPILSIGAVLFDPQVQDTFQTLHERSFLRLVDVEDAVRVCGPADGGTIKWWFTQTDAAIKRLVSGDCMPLRDALNDLWAYSHSRHAKQAGWLRSSPVATHIWSKGPDFDCKILAHACKQTKVRYPFHFSTQRDVRTAQDFGFPNGELPVFSTGRGEHEVVHHDARDDAIMQALMVQACFRQVGLARVRT